MAKITSFDEFEAAVINTLKQKGALQEDSPLFSILRGAVCGIVAPRRPSGGLSERRYKSYINDKYRSLFDAHKNDENYISRMIDTAARDILNLS